MYTLENNQEAKLVKYFYLFIFKCVYLSGIVKVYKMPTCSLNPGTRLVLRNKKNDNIVYLFCCDKGILIFNNTNRAMTEKATILSNLTRVVFITKIFFLNPSYSVANETILPHAATFFFFFLAHPLRSINLMAFLE